MSTSAPAAASPACTIAGTNGPDVLTGTPANDVICGGNGDDTLVGAGGNDTLIGGNGNDRLEGAEGDDDLDGGNGDDVLLGGAGVDTLNGGAGTDRLEGGAENDLLDGGNGNDTVIGEAGNDTLIGANGDDDLSGGEGDDSISGGNGTDIADGGSGTDGLEGGNGTDTLSGGPGPDELVGGNGNDALMGGAGNDGMDGGLGTDSCDGSTGANSFSSCETVLEDPTPEDPQADADGDGLPDMLEVALGSSSTGSDTDGDGISDADEYLSATDPLVADSDRNGISDGDDDTDRDGIPNSAELSSGTHPARSDSDADGVPDGAEVDQGTDPLQADSDIDGLDDLAEGELGSDPTLEDSDGDGVLDGEDYFERTVSLPDVGASVTVTGRAEDVLAVRLEITDDASLDEDIGMLGTAVDLYADGDLTGTLTLPFDPDALEPGAEVGALQLNEGSGVFQWAQYQTDLGQGLVSISLGPVNSRLATGAAVQAPCLSADPIDAGLPASTFVVVDVSQFEAIWQNEIEVARDPFANIDVVLALDSSGSMTTSDPDGARRVAASAFVDALGTGDRAAVVDFDDYAYVTQGLTDDADALKAAIASVDSQGGTHIGRALAQSLSELDENGSYAHKRVVVLLTDGQGTYWDYLTDSAIESETLVYTVGIGADADADLLASIATATGGKFYLVLESDDLSEVFGDIGSAVGEAIGTDQGVPDTDGDGLSDEAEVAGLRTGTGAVYTTDPANADTDGDGLTDGDEMGQLCYTGAWGAGTYYEGRSNPARRDSDGDGLDDWYEIANIMYPFKSDADQDGLSDYAEVMVHETDPNFSDTDADSYLDGWEVDNADAGFDPGVFDTRMEWWEYVGDFARGALCGDLSFWTFCESTSLAFLSGALAAGVAGVGDIRDGVAAVAKGDWVSAGLSVASLVPVVGDAASAVTKLVRHLKNSLEDVGSALRYLGRADNVPSSARIQALDEVFDGAATSLKNRGLTDDDLLAFARRGISPRHVLNVLDGASDVSRGAGKFTREVDAENLLRLSTPDAVPNRPGFTSTGTGHTNRYLDITDYEHHIGYEVKFGLVHDSGRAGRQVGRDADYLALSGANLQSIEWHFYANGRGVFGPDEALLERLQDLGIPYAIHLP